jgi:nucleotide-binding universal stress UspA family protein
MDPKLFHIWRNTPLGREGLLQSLYFCKTLRCGIVIYIPKFTKFLMYFENDVVQVDLDSSYLTDPSTALDHAMELAREAGITPTFLEPKNFTASTLPDISTAFDFMCCPRSISDLSSKIGLGYIGPRVRRIVQSAKFPVVISSPAFKPWQRIVVFFGGSVNALKSLRLGLSLHRRAGMPLEIFTQTENRTRQDYEKVLEEANLNKDLENAKAQWHFFESGNFEENLYKVPHDALVVLGAYGHGLIKDFIFGSKMEKIQSTVSNNLLIVGPKFQSGL